MARYKCPTLLPVRFMSLRLQRKSLTYPVWYANPRVCPTLRLGRAHPRVARLVVAEGLVTDSEWGGAACVLVLVPFVSHEYEWTAVEHPDPS